MSSIFESTRENIFSLIADFHSGDVPEIEINYPGKWITDVEHNTTQFVSIELDMRPRAMELPQRNVVRVSGQIILNHYVYNESGSKKLTEYSDKVFNYFSLRTINKITFMEVVPYSNVGKPGFYGTMNSIEFYVDYFNI